MPLTDFSSTGAAAFGTLPGKPLARSFQAKSSMAADEPTMTATEYRSALDWSQPDPTLSNLAVLDDFYDDRDDHGLQVWSVACECLYERMPSQQSPTPTSISCWRVTNGGNLNKSQLNPSLYFDRLKLVRDKGTIRVVNLSRGSADWTKMERAEMKAMEESQIVVVAAAGQERRSWMADFPASFPTVLSVGGVQKGWYALDGCELRV